MREFEESGSEEGVGYGQHKQKSFEKPVKPGDEIDVTIDTVGGKGDGVAKIKNFVIFVPGAQAGETIKVRIKNVKEKFAFAEKI